MATKLNVLELFAGTRSIGKAFERAGHKVTSYDWDDLFCPPCIKRDVYTISLSELKQYDVIWASPDCTTYSLVSGGKHRYKDSYTGELVPKSEYAKYCDENNTRLFSDLRECAKFGIVYFVENPRAGMRSMPFVRDMPRYTVTYCQYGDMRQKPTDIWTNCYNTWFKEPCKAGEPCHVPAPRGSRTGTCGLSAVDRARIPDKLCDAIVAMAEKDFEFQ